MPIYLDNAATSYPKPECVYEAVDRFARETGVSSGRGAYQLALESDRVVFDARQNLARLFGVRDASRICFTSNVTEALNLGLKGLLNQGDHVVTSSMEHNAVWRCLKGLEAQIGIQLSVVQCSPEGCLDPDDVRKAIRPNTRLIVILHASNVTGTILPLKEVGEIAARRGIIFAVDAAQTAGVLPLDVDNMQIDLLGFTGHKGLLGPPGTGGLYIREGIELRPLKEGGTGGESVLEHQPHTLPDRHEAGTLNVWGIAGLGASTGYILENTVESIRFKEMMLTSLLIETLRDIDGLTV